MSTWSDLQDTGRQLTGTDSVALLVVARLGAEVVDIGGSEDVEPESGLASVKEVRAVCDARVQGGKRLQRS